MKKDRQIQLFKRWGKYKNPYSKGLKHGLFDIVLWKTGFYRESLKNRENKKNFFKTFKKEFNKNLPSVVWINHSSFLIKTERFNILTDPIWSEKCSPISFLGPKRLLKPPFSIKDLPKIDFVLISHNHYDHLDKRTVLTLRKLFKDIKWIVPKGVKKWFLKKNIKNVFELNWWESFNFSDISITATPSQHFSGRHILDYNHSLWCGYVFENKKKRFYFAGDTGYNEFDFKEIGEKYKFMDLSLIPIGTYIPRKFMKPVHVNPEESVKIHRDINSKFSIGMHWKTFHLSDEPQNLPPLDLFFAMKRENLDPKDFVVLENGVYVNW